MAIVARLYRDARGAGRRDVAVDATLRDPERRPFDVTVEDISVTGVRIPAVVSLPLGAQVTIGIPAVGMCDLRVVRRDERGYGCEFLFPLSEAELAEAIAAEPQPPVQLVTSSVLPAPVPSRTPAPMPRSHAAVRIAVIAVLASACWSGLYWAVALVR